MARATRSWNRAERATFSQLKAFVIHRRDTTQIKVEMTSVILLRHTLVIWPDASVLIGHMYCKEEVLVTDRWAKSARVELF